MKSLIFRWLKVGLYGAIALHIIFGLAVFIHGVIPGSVCGNLEGYNDHACTFPEALSSLWMVPFLAVVFSNGLSIIIPAIVIFIMGLFWTYLIKRKKNQG